MTLELFRTVVNGDLSKNPNYLLYSVLHNYNGVTPTKDIFDQIAQELREKGINAKVNGSLTTTKNEFKLIQDNSLLTIDFTEKSTAQLIQEHLDQFPEIHSFVFSSNKTYGKTSPTKEDLEECGRKFADTFHVEISRHVEDQFLSTSFQSGGYSNFTGLFSKSEVTGTTMLKKKLDQDKEVVTLSLTRR